MKVEPIRDLEKIEEIKAVLLDRSKRDYFLFVFGINSGLRISDILKFKVKDVKNKTHIVLTETKTRKTNRILLTVALRGEIVDYIRFKQDEDWLFPSRKGVGPISRSHAYLILNQAAKKVGLEEIGTHTMRKTFGYHHYKQFKDVAALQQIFNHSSPSITLKYIGITQDMLDEQMAQFNL